MSALRIGVAGAGAIGCFCGGRLAAIGADVKLVGRERIRNELAEHDLTLTDFDHAPVIVPKANVQIADELQFLADCDVVLVAVKSSQTAEVGKDLARVLGKRNTVVISFQNGVRNADVLREHLPNAIVLGAIVSFNVVGAGDGVFKRTTTGPLIIEANEDARVRDLESSLKKAGFEVELTDDIRAHQWTKLVSNVNNAVGALTDMPTQQLLFDARYRKILRALIAETIGVMDLAKISPAKAGPIPVRYFPMLLALPTPILRVAMRAQLKVDPEARSSMWQDLSLGRMTEVDELNGEIVKLAEAHGGDAPMNRRIVKLVHEVEQRRNGSPKMSAESLWIAIHS
ncbi:MAG: 2-dehydropantoate 2-reductase [Polyangiaceae bacterium]